MPPRLARLLAAVVAIALVVGAFAVRGALSDDDEDDPSTGSGQPAGEVPVFRMACDEDVDERVCAAVAAAADRQRARDIEVEVVRAGVVIERATSGESTDWDLWLTLDPLPAVLDVARQQATLPPLTTGGPTAVSSSRLALLALPETPGDCADEIAVGTACVIEADASPAVAVPASDTSVGILAIAAGATALHGDEDFGIGAFDGTPESDVLGGFLDDSPGTAGTTTADQTNAMVVQRGAASAAITLEALAERQAGTVQGRGRELRSVPLGPEVVVGLTLVGLGPDGPAAVDALSEGVTGQTVREALVDAGWTGDPLPTDGLPEDPGLIYALQERLG